MTYKIVDQLTRYIIFLIISSIMLACGGGSNNSVKNEQKKEVTFSFNTLNTKEVLGSFKTNGSASASVLSSDSKKAFVIGDKGLQIVDISDPSSPALLGAYNIAKHDKTTTNIAYDIVLSNDESKAFVTTVANIYDPITTKLGKLQIIDISNPSSPILLGNYSDSDMRSFKFSNDKRKIFITSSSGLKIVDISNPSTPLLLATYKI
ncbi:MAG: hypothetical protein KAG34_08265, partial [Cocleimonas sp.]|nr:hypothetical protein [Cocleimonas sp.]